MAPVDQHPVDQHPVDQDAVDQHRDRGDLDARILALLTTPEGRADPLPCYHEMHARAPIFRTSFGPWIASRYADCQTVLRDPRFAKSQNGREGRLRLAGASAQELDDVASLVEFFDDRQSMLTLNPPDHTRLRGLVARAFTAHRVEALRPHVESLTDRLLDRLVEAGGGGAPVDVMSLLAFPLPVTVIGELLGVPEDDRAQFQGLIRRMTASLEPGADLTALAGSRDARIEVETYFVGLIAERRARPADDLLSALIDVRDGSDRLSEMEMISTAILLFGAGFETTTNLIGNGLLALLGHPDEMSRWRTDPSLSATAVVELLRWDSPVQLDGRTAHEDVELAGHTIARDDVVLTLIGAANRDPDHYHDPDRFDLGRDEGPPMSFGSGIHYCLGAALARMEGQVVFDRLLRRFASVELATDRPRYRDSLTLRGLVDLPVAVRPS